MSSRGTRWRRGVALAAMLGPAAIGLGAAGVPVGVGVFAIAGFLAGTFAAALARQLVEEEEAAGPVDLSPGKLSWYLRLPILGSMFRREDEPPLEWFQRIPMIGLFIDGWRSCEPSRLRLRESPRPGGHLAVELLCSALFGAAAWSFEPRIAVAAAGFIALLVVVSIVDWETRIIPDELNALGLVAMLLHAGFAELTSTPDAFVTAVTGAVVGAGALYLVGEFGRFVVGIDAMGGGDIKLMAVVGAFLGAYPALIALLIASVLTGPVGLVLRLTGRARCEQGFTVMAYGPFLAAGALIVLFCGPI